MDNLVKFPLKGKVRLLKGAVEVYLPRAVDYVLSAERQMWRILAAGPSDDSEYLLALMVASGNIDDGIQHLTEMKRQIDELISSTTDRKAFTE